MRLEKASYKAIKYACIKFHYAKSVPVNVFGYSVFNNKNEWCGVILYGAGANPRLGEIYKLKQGENIELVRVALNGKQELTSIVVSISLKLIKKDLPLIKLVISFADQNQKHFGIIYQATNWYYTGIGKSTPQYYVNKKWIHQRQLGSLGYSVKNNKFKKRLGLNKYRYIYPLHKSMIQLCKELSKPYPKKNACIA